MSDDLFGFSDEFNSFDNDVADDKTLSTEFLAEDENLELAFGDLPNKETALFRLDLIRYLERRVKGGWTPKNLDKLLEEYALLKKTSVPSSRTIADWKKLYYESGKDVASLIPGHSKKGNRKLKNDSSDLVTEAIQTKFLTKERVSVNTAYEYYKYRVIEENRPLDQVKIAPISQRTFYNRVNALPPYEVALARYGKRYADNKFKTVGSIIPATRPMEYVEIDHTTAPVILLDDDLELPLGRPHLTILYDRYSTCIVGLSVNYRDPSYETVRAAFLNSVLKKDWIKEKYPSIKSEWPCYGKITNLIVDNGAEFWSDSLESALKPLVTDIQYNQRGKPWRKAGVEKSFDTFYKKLFSRFPGKTFTNPTQLKDYNPKRDAVINVSDFLELLHKWLIDVYHKKADTRYKRVPYQKWTESQGTIIFCEGPEAEQLKIELGVVNHRTIRRGAIELHSLKYQSDELEEYGKQYSSRARKSAYVKTKTDPNDISSIYVYLEEEKKYIKVPAVDHTGYTKGRSLYEHQRINSLRRLKVRLGEQDESLADASLYLDRAMDEAIERMSRSKSKKSALPKTTHASKIAKQRGVGSEGPSTIVTKSPKPISEVPKEAIDMGTASDDLSDIEGY
ncbi:Mu transposase C-terminal domain-containing protein [Vibrio sp. Evd11]|uniref:Mu transposase C-terminal domain-containing protein n=1 Tax=Vibrio sp. Evd11 TaxID=1207404 RepID=UPI000EFD6BCA|nr:Mu transposase C-terminal domain-containing protein [Vibrio sp. Evd11]